MSLEELRKMVKGMRLQEIVSEYMDRIFGKGMWENGSFTHEETKDFFWQAYNLGHNDAVKGVEGT